MSLPLDYCNEHLSSNGLANCFCACVFSRFLIQATKASSRLASKWQVTSIKRTKIWAMNVCRQGRRKEGREGEKKGISSNNKISDLTWSASKENMSLLGRLTMGLDFVSKPASAQQENKLSEHQRISHTCSNTNGPRDYHHQGFPGGSDGKESAHNAGDPGSPPGLRRSPGEAHGNPLQYSCLENPLGQRSLLGYSPWGRKELDTTEQIHFQRLSY